MDDITVPSYVNLGKTDIKIRPLGVGTWQWGDKTVWGYNKQGYGDEDIEKAFLISLESGINLFDTAEVYGLGRSERIIGNLLKSYNPDRIVIATKFFPFPWRLTRRQFRRALKNSLKRLGMQSVHLYQIHFPIPPVKIRTWMEEMAYAKQEGLIQAVGVSNYNLEQTEKAVEVLKEFDIPLASNQVEYSLIHRDIEKNGVLDFCKENNITILAYSPLGQGILTGKYNRNNPPPGPRGRKYGKDYLAKIEPLLQAMETIAQKHNVKVAQVALNWTISKGTIPIPGAKNEKQAKENAATLAWSLTDEEVEMLDNISETII